MINVKWNEDKTEATLSSADFENLQGNFDKGYKKGIETGQKKTLELFSFLELDPNNLEAGIEPLKKQLLDIKAGKFPDELMKKIKDTDIVKDLQTKLEEKITKYQELETSFTTFKKSQLIDSKLLELGAASKAIDAKVAAQVFKNDYQVDLGDGDKIIIKNANGNVLFNEKGDELQLQDVFQKFTESRSYLFEGANRGGSGGGGGNGTSGSKIISKAEFNAKEPKERAELMSQGYQLKE